MMKAPSGTRPGKKKALNRRKIEPDHYANVNIGDNPLEARSTPRTQGGRHLIDDLCELSETRTRSVSRIDIKFA